MRAFIEAAPRSWKDILEEYIGQNSGRLLAYGNLRAELGRLMEAPHFPTPSRPTVISSVTPRRRPTIVGTTSTDPPDRQERTNTMVGPYEKRTAISLHPWRFRARQAIATVAELLSRL